jgi:hypothetical protein
MSDKKTAPGSIILLLIVLSPCVRAAGRVPGEPDTTSFGPVLLADGTRALSTMGTVLTNPVRWEGRDWMRFGGTCAVTFGLSFADAPMRDAMHRSRSRTADDAAEVATWVGDGVVVLGASAGGYLAGAAFHDRWLRETSVMLGTTVLTSAIVSSVLKAVVGRARPYVGIGPGTFKPFKFQDSFYSFPSGHSEMAFALATVLSRRIDNTIASIALYGAAGSVALSRMYLDEHWVSDVVFGGAISYFVGNAVVDLLERNAGDGHAGIQIIPEANGVTVAFAW